MDENAAFLFEAMTSCQLWALQAPAVIADCFSADLALRCKPRGETMIYLPGARPWSKMDPGNEPPQAAE